MLVANYAVGVADAALTLPVELDVAKGAIGSAVAAAVLAQFQFNSPVTIVAGMDKYRAEDVAERAKLADSLMLIQATKLTRARSAIHNPYQCNAKT